MATLLFQVSENPIDIAITKTEFISGGLYFLDFSRPLERFRWFGVLNRWFGFTDTLIVPVVHQGESNGVFVVGVHRSDPYFKNVIALWKEYYPSKRNSPEIEADVLERIADFARQFPSDSQS